MELLKIVNKFSTMIPAYCYYDHINQKVLNKPEKSEEDRKVYEDETSYKLSLNDTINVLITVYPLCNGESKVFLDKLLKNKEWISKVQFITDCSYRVVSARIGNSIFAWNIKWHAIYNNHTPGGLDDLYDNITQELIYEQVEKVETLFIFIRLEYVGRGFKHIYPFIAN